MPAYPDPTHPRFLEGDEMVPPRMESDDDVEGHVRVLNQPADDEVDPADGQTQLRSADQPAADETDPADGESLTSF